MKAMFKIAFLSFLWNGKKRQGQEDEYPGVIAGMFLKKQYSGFKVPFSMR